MSIREFQSRLEKTKFGPGAKWFKADFHVHAPNSFDYEYKAPDAAERLGRAIAEADYQFVVVLKHQEFPSRAELDTIRTHCPGTTLVPGAEINVFVEALSKKIAKDYFFHCIVAVDPDVSGDYGYVLQKAQERLSYRQGEYPAGFRSSVLDVGKFFRENGALFIPAHLHKSEDPENSRSVDDIYDDESFLGFVRDGAFDALEVRQASTATFFDGTKTTNEGLRIPSCVCIASSDAHHPDHIALRNRCTWVCAEKPSFHELAAALSFPHRISLEKPEITHQRILGLHVSGSFFPESWVILNEGLNAFIGGKGSGKTALLECLRFVLNAPVPKERSESVKHHVEHVLGSSGYVECLIQRPNGSPMLISRRADSPDRILVVDDSGGTRVLNSTDKVPFPVSILGWHEIEAVADKASTRIALLDHIEDEGRGVSGLYKDISTHVERARDQLLLLQRHTKKLDGMLKDLWELRRKRSTLQRLEQGDLLTLQQQYEWYLLTEQQLIALKNNSSQRSVAVPEGVISSLSLELKEAPTPDVVGPAADSLAGVMETLCENAATETRSITELQGVIGKVLVAADQAINYLAVSFSGFRESVYTPKVNALPPEDREILTKQILVLEETKRLPLVEKECEELLKTVTSTSRELSDICDAICKTREQIVAGREQLVSSINREMGSVIQLRFLRSANKESRSLFQNRYGNDGVILVGYVQRFGKPESYENLKALFDKLTLLSLDQGQWDITDTLWDIRLLELLDVFDEDDVEIALAVGKAGFVPMKNLSAGQRCVAVFPLLLRNTRGPLVIDQPEDNLDNRYIADVIAPDLLHRKQRQQFIVTSHNANLVVLTDADLVIHFDSDGTTSFIPAAGFLSCATSTIRQSVLDVLDGGEAALAARQRKYGIRN